MTFLKSLDSPPFIATYRWAGSFDGRYMPQAYSLLLELNQNTYLPVVKAEFDILYHQLRQGVVALQAGGCEI
jgi:hypothetical protein